MRLLAIGMGYATTGVRAAHPQVWSDVQFLVFVFGARHQDSTPNFKECRNESHTHGNAVRGLLEVGTAGVVIEVIAQLIHPREWVQNTCLRKPFLLKKSSVNSGVFVFGVGTLRRAFLLEPRHIADINGPR